MNITKYIVLAVVFHPTYGMSATIYLDEVAYIAALSAGGYATLQEGFENDIVWANSRTSATPSVISQGITWTSNHTMNGVRTGTLGGSVVDGTYGFFSLPHGDDTDSGLYCDDAEDPIPTECWLNDGWMITAPVGETLFGVGGWFDSNTGGAKVTFLLDGVDVNGNDTDNIDNWMRDGDRINGWTFVGVIDTNGFASAEVLELSGKDFQQEFIFGDKFSIGVTAAPALPGDFDTDGDYDCADVDSLVAEIVVGTHNPAFDLTGDSLVDGDDLHSWLAEAGTFNVDGPYLRGDADLNGVVDGQDFIVWNGNKFTEIAAWCAGDFSADGTVDGQDFILWNGNKFMSSDGVASVPEPSTVGVLIATVIGLAAVRRR
jgi:hypothetical protein